MNKKGNTIGLIAFIVNYVIFFINLCIFIPMLIEQIRTGAGTNLELGVLYIWLIVVAMSTPLLVSSILTIISIAKKDCRWRVICNIIFVVLSITMMTLTTIFTIL